MGDQRGREHALDGDVGVAGVVVEGLNDREEIHNRRAARLAIAIEKVVHDGLVLGAV